MLFMSEKPYIPQQWETVSCPFCNSTNRREYEKFGDINQFTYVVCLDCSLVYQSPRPRYESSFVQLAYENYHLMMSSHTYGIGHSERFDEELSEIIRFDQKRSRILDVGSALGDFLYFAKSHYPQVMGVEVSNEMARFSEVKLEIPVVVGQFHELEFNELFTCIHMSHVFEHIPWPVEWLRKARSLLEDNGVLVICVPNMFGLNRRSKLLLKRLKLRSGKWKKAGRTPDHLFEPTHRSMLRLLDAQGFEVVRSYTYSRKNMISQGLMSRVIHRWLKIGSNLRFFARVKQ